MNRAARLSGWRRALAIILGMQLVFWSGYALIVAGLSPAETLEQDRLWATRPALADDPGQTAAFVAELPGPAILRIPGWQPVMMLPARSSLLSRAEGAPPDGMSLVCLEKPCPGAAEVYAGPIGRLSPAARWERFQRFDMVWVAIAVAVVTGAALLMLLPVNRTSRLQAVTGLFQILVGADAWLTTFGAESLPYDWFPLLRFGTDLMLTGAALAVNAFAGWHAGEARVAGACFGVTFALLLGTMATGSDVATIVPWLDAAALVLLVGYGLRALLRWRIARRGRRSGCWPFCSRGSPRSPSTCFCGRPASRFRRRFSPRRWQRSAYCSRSRCRVGSCSKRPRRRAAIWSG